MLYSSKGENFVHEFPISYDDLEKKPELIYRSLLTSHIGYLDTVEPGQITALIEKIKNHHKEQQFEDLNKRVAELDLDLGESGSDDLDAGMYQDADINYDDLELDMAEDMSDEDDIII